MKGRVIYAALLMTALVNTEKYFAAVIPADAGIQYVSGCRIESGMTNYLATGTIEDDFNAP
jgi:hypothetical protein